MNIGAYAWKDEEGGRKKGDEKDYYLVEFLELPKTAQGDKEDSAWTVECHHLNAVPTAPLWHTSSFLKVTVDVTKLVATDLEMHPMSPTNMIKCRSKRVREEAEQKKAMKLSEESHEFILDEIRMRERVEHDPSRVFVAADDDSESDEDDEHE